MVAECGYSLEETGADASSQNGIAERPNQTFGHMMRCMLDAANIGKEFKFLCFLLPLSQHRLGFFILLMMKVQVLVPEQTAAKQAHTLSQFSALTFIVCIMGVLWSGRSTISNNVAFPLLIAALLLLLRNLCFKY